MLLKSCSSQVAGKIGILERNIATSKVRRLQRVLRSRGQALPRNERLRAAHRRRREHGVVQRKDALVLDERLRPRQREPGGRAGPVTVLRRTHCDDVAGARGAAAR